MKKIFTVLFSVLAISLFFIGITVQASSNEVHKLPQSTMEAIDTLQSEAGMACKLVKPRSHICHDLPFICDRTPVGKAKEKAACYLLFYSCCIPQ